MIDEIDNLLLGGNEILSEADQESNELWKRFLDWVKLGNLTFHDSPEYLTMFLQDRPSEASRQEEGWSRLKWTLNDRIHNLYMIREKVS